MSNLPDALSPEDLAVIRQRIKFAFTTYNGSWKSFVNVQRQNLGPEERRVLSEMSAELKLEASQREERIQEAMQSAIPQLLNQLFKGAMTATKIVHGQREPDWNARYKGADRLLELARGGHKSLVPYRNNGIDATDTDFDVPEDEDAIRDELERLEGQLSLRNRQAALVVDADERSPRGPAPVPTEDADGTSVQGAMRE